jgi:Zn-dependent protease
MAVAGVNVNLVLMALNLLPILPLDGGRILFSLLPNRLAWQYSKIEPYGLVIVVILLVTDVLWLLMRPVLSLGTTIVQWFL